MVKSIGKRTAVAILVLALAGVALALIAAPKPAGAAEGDLTAAVPVATPQVYASTKAKTENMKGKTIDKGTYIIVSATDNQLTQLVGVKGNSKKNKAYALLQKETGKKAQRWTIEWNGYTDSYSIINKNSKKALAVKGKKAKKGARVYQVKSKHGSGSQPKNQRWQIVATKKGYKIVSALNKKYVLNVEVDGRISITKSNNSVQQRFWLLEANTWNTKKAVKANNLLKDGYYIMQPSGVNELLTLGEKTAAKNTKMVLSKNEGELDQAFKIEHLAGAYYKITNVASGKVLAAKGTLPGSPVVQQAYKKKANNQRWKAKLSDQGGIVFINKESKLALDVNGTRAVTMVENPLSATQRWNISPTTTNMTHMQLRALDKANSNTSDTNYYLSIDYTNHRLFVFERDDEQGLWTILHQWTCSTASPGVGKGLLKINKNRNSKTTGIKRAQNPNPEEDQYTIYWWTGLGWGTWIHSIVYRPYSYSVQDGRLGYSITSGCTRVSRENAKWVYDHIEKGTGRSTYV